MQWQLLYGMEESAVTISRAVERGWAVLQGSKPRERKVALTDDGRRFRAGGDSARGGDQGQVVALIPEPARLPRWVLRRKMHPQTLPGKVQRVPNSPATSNEFAFAMVTINTRRQPQDRGTSSPYSPDHFS